MRTQLDWAMIWAASFVAVSGLSNTASSGGVTPRASQHVAPPAGSFSQTPVLGLGSNAGNAPSGFSAPFKPPPPPGAATRWVSPLGSDNNPGTQAQPWRQIAHAAALAQPGDIIEILDGTYDSPIEIQVQGSAAQRVIFRASGNAALVSGAGTNPVDRDAVFITFSSYVTVHGLRISNAYRSGVRVDQSDHCRVQACVCANNGRWGIFTDFADDLFLIGNECYGSVLEHGIYHSNSSDRGVLRGNYCHDNWSSGIQINADPSQGGDGISSDCVVDRNLLVRNGLGNGMGGGGAAINLASVRTSTIQNNVLIDNKAGGISMWDDGQGIQWGSKNNVVRHNTVLFKSGEGRYALLFWNGSTNNRFENNLLIGGARGALTFTPDSLTGLASDRNLLFSLSNWPLVENETTGQTYNFAGWQALGYDLGSLHANAVFTNAAGQDWSLAPGSPGRDAGLVVPVKTDYQGALRPVGSGFDMGAYER